MTPTGNACPVARVAGRRGRNPLASEARVRFPRGVTQHIGKANENRSEPRHLKIWRINPRPRICDKVIIAPVGGVERGRVQEEATWLTSASSPAHPLRRHRLVVFQQGLTMLDLLPAWIDEHLSRVLSPWSRQVSRWLGREDKPLCAQASPFWAAIIGRRHCEGSREEWQ